MLEHARDAGDSGKVAGIGPGPAELHVDALMQARGLAHEIRGRARALSLAATPGVPAAAT